MNDLCTFDNTFIIVIRNKNGIVYMNSDIGKELSEINLNDTYILLNNRFYVCNKEKIRNQIIEIYYDITDYLNTKNKKKYVYD